MTLQMVALNVRGKKRSRKPQAAADLAIGTAGGRGRPMKTAKELKWTKRAGKAPSPSVVSNFKTKSWLERLPAELIEQIFLHALETNMPRASPFLGRTLAKGSIYRVLILFAFFDDDEEHPVETKYFAPASYRLLNWVERTRLQTGVLESRWCNLARIKQCFPILKRLVIVQQWHHDRTVRNQDAKTRALGQQGISQPTAASEPQPDEQLPPHLPELMDHDSLLRYYWDEEYLSCSKPLWEVNVLANGGKRSIFHVRYLPNRLLDPHSWRGPNSDPAAVTFLHQLYLGYIDKARATDHRPNDPMYSNVLVNHDALSRGIGTAICEHNGEALRMLLRIFDSTSDATTLREEWTENSSELRVGALVMKWLHLAVRQGSESPWITRLILLERVHLVDTDDRVLTKWAIGAANAGDRFALKYLLEGPWMAL